MGRFSFSTDMILILARLYFALLIVFLTFQAQAAEPDTLPARFSSLEAKARSGDAGSQYSVGLLYETGTGVAPNRAAATKWLRKSADQGFAAAQVRLGQLYEAGHDGRQDFSGAARWYRIAANQGYPDGEYSLGVFYNEGHGVPLDYAEAAKWYQRTANQGNADAQNALGVLYEQGQGVRRSFEEAYFWQLLAANSDKYYNVFRDHLAAYVSLKQRADVKQRALMWRPDVSNSQTRVSTLQ